MSKVPEWVIVAVSLVVFIATVWLLIFLGGRHYAKPLVEAADGHARGATAQAGVATGQLHNSNSLGTSLDTSQKRAKAAIDAVQAAPTSSAANDEFLRGLHDLQSEGGVEPVPGR